MIWFLSAYIFIWPVRIGALPQKQMERGGGGGRLDVWFSRTIQGSDDRDVLLLACLGRHAGYNLHPNQRHLVLAF